MIFDDWLNRQTWWINKNDISSGVEPWRYENIARQAWHACQMDMEQKTIRYRIALQSYAQCSDGCTCGDGWCHDTAINALEDGDA